MSLLKLVVAQLSGAKLVIATHVVGKRVVAKLDLARRMDQLMKLVELDLVEPGTQLLVGNLLLVAGVESGKLEVETPS